MAKPGAGASDFRSASGRGGAGPRPAGAYAGPVPRRLLAILLLALLVGVGWLLHEPAPAAPTTEDEPGPQPEAHRPPETPEEQALADRLRLEHGLLTIRVQNAEGKPPYGSEIGYRRLDGGTRWLYAGDSGVRTIEDAPLGPLTCVAKAPGMQENEQRCVVIQGVRCEVLITLVPVPKAEPEGGSDG